MREYEALVDAAGGWIRRAPGANELLGYVRPTGREVFIPPLVDRIAHAALVEVLRGPVVRAASRRSFAYLPGRDRILALGCARRLVRDGFVHAAKLDISRFFPTSPIALVRRALRDDHTTVDRSLRRVAAFLYHAPIVRRSTHPHVVEGTASMWEPARDTLLPGPASAPLLSEIVGHHVIDKHFDDAWRRGAQVLRYADDILVLGRSLRATRSTIIDVVARLEDEGFEINRAKSVMEPLDLREGELRWLGKTLAGTEVRSDRARTLRLAEKLASELQRDDVGAIVTLLTELTLDPVESFRAVLSEVGSLGLSRVRLDELIDWKRRRRDVLQQIAVYSGRLAS